MDAVVSLIRSSGAARLVVVDVETTGLRGDDRIAEIAMLAIEEDGSRGERYETLVDPGRRMGAAAARVNGIDDRMLVGAPAFGDVAGDVAAFLTGSCIVAHNAGFDVRMMASAFGDLGVRFDAGRPVDTYTMTGVRLEESLRRTGIRSSGLHRAMADVEATAELLLRIAGSATPGSPVRIRPMPTPLRTPLRPRDAMPADRTDDDGRPRHRPGDRVGPRPGSLGRSGGATVDTSDRTLERALEPILVEVLLVAGSHVVISTLTEHTKAEVIDHAESIGLIVKPEVSRQTSVLITDDLDSPSRRALKARSLGVPLARAQDLLVVDAGGVLPALGDAARLR